MQVNSCSWSPDGAYIVSCSEDKTMRVWDDSNRGEYIASLIGHEDKVSIEPENSHLGQVEIDEQTFAVVNEMQVNACSWSPDGTKIMSCSEDRTVRVWELSDSPFTTTTVFEQDVSGFMIIFLFFSQCNLSPQMIYLQCLTCAWSPDSTKVAIGDRMMARIWDMSLGECIATLYGHEASVRYTHLF
jgi:WD40 repeat protein